MTNLYPKTDRLEDLLPRLPEPDRSIILTNRDELLRFIIESPRNRGIAQNTEINANQQSVQDTNVEQDEGDNNNPISDSEIEWPLDFIRIKDDLYSFVYMIDPLPEPARSEGLRKLLELGKLILDSTFKAVSVLDMPMQYVQFSKDYRVGESTIRILGLTYEFGYTEEEVIEKTKFLMTSDIASKKHNPTASHIYWDAPTPDGGEYIKGSFSCTGVVYQAIPEQYIHEHSQGSIPIRIVNGMWQHNLDDIRPYRSEYNS
ncbi:hypothetical protein [Pantanalinema sp. GBBB05]|uniref:hypothetical protein n=1 Tax=Pantanalinema sp. GBBB05 TaxID=2604139 RepID=UPI001DA5D052|nr:hypothetical protein [Pantanalinema sp. GBBB05]